MVGFFLGFFFKKNLGLNLGNLEGWWGIARVLRTLENLESLKPGKVEKHNLRIADCLCDIASGNSFSISI